MFGRRHPVRVSHHDVSLHDGARASSASVAQTCAALLEALSQFAACRSILDGDLPLEASDEEIADALDAVRAARQRCDRVAQAVLQARPRTKAEAAARRDALSVYLTQLDVDQLTRRSFLEAVPGNPAAAASGATFASDPPSQNMPRKAWLRRGTRSNPV